MSKLEFASTYAVIATIMVIFMLYIGRNADEKGIHVRRQLHLIFVMDVLYFTSFFVNDVDYLIWNHCLVQALVAWIALMFADFSIGFAASNLKWRKYFRIIFISLTAVDNICLIINAATKFFFGFTAERINSGSYYVYPIWDVWCTMHFAFVVLLIWIFIGVMIKKCIESSSLYRGRYLFLSISFVGGMLLCLFFHQIGNYMNFPVVIFLTMGECVIFYVYYHLPKVRISKMKNFVIKNVTMPIMMFDYDDELQVLNEPARQIMDVELGISLQEFINNNNLKYILTPERRAAGKTKEFTLTMDQKGKTYLIHGQELWDEKYYFVGTLLVYNDISRQEMLKEEADFHATKDNLTGLWNREYFMELARRTLDEDKDRDYVVIMSDIFQFKMFNDILGTQMGDDLIISIARGYEDRRRDNWLFARFAGDRFAMLMPKEDFNQERFVTICKNVIEKREYKLTVHFYLGIYEITDRKLSIEEMCDRADMALESVKGDMSRNVAYYDEEIRKRRIHETLNADELEKALKEKQFTIYLQPQIDSCDNTMVGCEALARWISPTKGLISPAEFIPSFEENGMIYQLDYYIWECACILLKKWKNQGETARSVSVNISAKDFYLTDIYKSLTGLVEKYDINPANLKLEITETAFVLNVKEQMKLVRRLQERGFIIEVDDFGSGYSSLNSLKDIDVDVLKLDMKFFEKTEDQARAEKIIESVVNLAYNLKMPVIAEGVESEDQIEMLKRIGCRIIQGFYYAKPMPVEEFEQFKKEYPFRDIKTFVDELKGEK